MAISITVKELIAKVGPLGVTQHVVERNCRGAIVAGTELRWQIADEGLFVVSPQELRSYFNLPEPEEVTPAPAVEKPTTAVEKPTTPQASPEPCVGKPVTVPGPNKEPEAEPETEPDFEEFDDETKEIAKE